AHGISPQEASSARRLREFIRKTAEELRQFAQLLKAVGPSITFFGSARIPEGDPAFIFTQELAAMFSEAGYPIVTGGGQGIMYAANKGVLPGKMSIGLGIKLPQEQKINTAVNLPLIFKYFFTRKTALLTTDAVIIMPGGFGTLDEFFEAMVLKDKRLTRDIPIVLVSREFYSGLYELLQDMENRGFFRRPLSELVVLLDSKEEVFDYVMGYQSESTGKNGNHINIEHAIRRLYKTFERVKDVPPGVGILGSQFTAKGSSAYKNAKALARALGERGIPVIYKDYYGISHAAWKGSREVSKTGKKDAPKAVAICFKGDYPKTQAFRPKGDFRLGVNYSFEQKIALLQLAKAGLVIFPGGPGTMDMFFEDLCLIQTQKVASILIILFDSEFWMPWDKWIRQKLLRAGVISKEDVDLYTIVDTQEEFITHLRAIASSPLDFKEANILGLSEEQLFAVEKLSYWGQLATDKKASVFGFSPYKDHGRFVCVWPEVKMRYIGLPFRYLLKEALKQQVICHSDGKGEVIEDLLKLNLLRIEKGLPLAEIIPIPQSHLYKFKIKGLSKVDYFDSPYDYMPIDPKTMVCLPLGKAIAKATGHPRERMLR
ncbi:MAG: LOG family protein, partial [Candidatus Omnitrophota bacterium]